MADRTGVTLYADPVTDVFELALLLEGFGSGSEELTRTVPVI